MEEILQIHDTNSVETVRAQLKNGRKRLYLETYGCQMNVYDSELVTRIMAGMDYELIDDYHEADAIFLNTCAIRENAEQRVWGQLTRFKQLKERRPELIIGVLGCMAKHLEKEIHDKRPYVNLVLGPDSYKKLPELIRPESLGLRPADPGEDFSIREFHDLPDLQMDTRLSKTEVYEGVEPLRLGKTTAWIAIMRGCDNFCTFCVVPFTRGRERSRSVESVVEEARRAVDKGYSEICLLGQNVNSYRDGANSFTDLMAKVSDIPGVLRVRFTSPHPKDFPASLLHLIAERKNLSKQIHMPVQSGSNRILELMNRTYTREEYLALIEKTREIIQGVAITTDVICGFPTESEQDHQDTVDLFCRVEFDAAYTFKYSARPGTKANNLPDDVSEEIKSSRLAEIMELQRRVGDRKFREEIGKIHSVLLEDVSRKSADYLFGKTNKAQAVVVPKVNLRPGMEINVRIVRAEGQTLFGELAT